jgi:butyryl-CoA dehydrogenase
MLLAQKSYVEGAMGLLLYCAGLVDKEKTGVTGDSRAQARMLLDFLTPVAKSWPSQWCLEANNLAIQVHGGYGYTRDYDVEQHYRDNRLNPIHEGTHGVQGLDLLGRKVAMDNGAGLRLLTANIDATVHRAVAQGGQLAELGAALKNASARLARVTAALLDERDPTVRLANSSVYLEATGHVVIAWIWLEQAIATIGKSGDFYDGKRQTAHFFFAYELPKTTSQFDLLEALDSTTLKMKEGWF